MPDSAPQPTLALGELVGLFLRFLEASCRSDHCAPRTVQYYRSKLEQFLAAVGADRPVAGIRKLDVMEHCTTWHQIQAVQRLFNWALDEEPPLVSCNPAKKIQRPPLGQRTLTLTPREAAMLRRKAPRRLREFLTAMQETLARPQEVRALRWDHIRTDGQAFILKTFKAKKRRKDGVAIRTIPITPRLQRLLMRLARRGEADGIIFRNDAGLPWSTNAICLRMRRLRRRLKLNDDIVAYTFRHSGATTAIRNETDLTQLGRLMGHSSPRTTEKYVHLDAEDIIKASRKATARKKPKPEPKQPDNRPPENPAA